MVLLSTHGIKLSSPHTCPLMTPKVLALGFLTTRKPVVGTQVLQQSGDSWLLSLRPCSMPRLAWGQACYPQNAACLGPKHHPRILLAHLEKQFLGSVGSGKTSGEPRESSSTSLQAGTFGKHFGNLDTRGYQTHVLWLGKNAKGSIYDGDIFC